MANLAQLDETITLDALDRDPFPIYRRLRAEAPVCRVKAAGRTLLTKAADTKYVKDNPDLFSSDDPNTPMKRAFWAHTLMRKDGEAHKRERMAMAPAFGPKVITQEWMPRYQKIAEDYVARLPRGEVVDLFAILSGAYAARGLAILLGMEDATDEDMMEWSQALIEGAGKLNTTIYGLLTNPDQFEQVKANGDWTKAFEEGVRWVAPISASSRLVTQDTEIRGCFVPKGDTVMTIQASANRDEDVVSNGEVFDVYRDDCQHQSFGNGPHFCQGTHVARRAVGQIMLPILFDRFPNATIPDRDAVIWRGFGFRGPVALPVLLN